MSDLKISQLTAAGSLDGTEQVPVNQSGTRRTTLNLIKTWILSALGSAAYAATTAFEAAGAVAAGIADHVAASDPHTQYHNDSRGDSRYDALGAATAAVSAHVDLPDPHTQYLTESNAEATYTTPLAVSALINYHSLLDDPHSLSYYTKTYVSANFQPKDATLTAFAGLTNSANKIPYFTDTDTMSTFDSTSYGRSLLNSNDAAALRTLAGLGSLATQSAVTLLQIPLNSLFKSGRITLSSTDPAPSSVSSSSTVYFLPYEGNVVSVPNGSDFMHLTYSSLSVALTSLASGNIYDVIIYQVAGTLYLDLMPAWTNTTTRASGIEWQVGNLVNSGSITTVRNGHSLSAYQAIVVGTIRLSATATCTQTVTKMYIANTRNTLRYGLANQYSATYNYTTSSWRIVNNVGAKVEFIQPYGSLIALGSIYFTATTLAAGMSFDSTTSPLVFAGSHATFNSGSAAWNFTVTQGYHYFECLELGVSGSSGGVFSVNYNIVY